MIDTQKETVVIIAIFFCHLHNNNYYCLLVYICVQILLCKSYANLAGW